MEPRAPWVKTIDERCSACHVPLHRGRELHWRRGMGGIFAMYLTHHCRERPVTPKLAQ